MTGRFSFPDPKDCVGKEILEHAYEIQIRFNLCDHGPVASYHVEGTMNQPMGDGSTAIDWTRLYKLLEWLKTQEGMG